MRWVVRAVAAALTGYVCLSALGRRAGSTSAERAAPLPGDQRVRRPQLVTNHATTIDAPPTDVWPWLSQMGWHRAGWYTPAWVDRVLFPQNRASLDHLDQELLRDLAVGDIIPDGPPRTAWFAVEEVECPHVLVLHSNTHLPPSWKSKPGVCVDWTWCFVMNEQPGNCTRLQLRVRGRMSPWWLTISYLTGVFPADFVMARGMLRGIKGRVERRG
jgi:hypothetical protein